MKEKLLTILKKAHESCEHEEGVLKNLTFEALQNMNESFVKECSYCPFEPCNQKICSGTEEVIYGKMCYECNKCGKWSSPWD